MCKLAEESDSKFTGRNVSIEKFCKIWMVSQYARHCRRYTLHTTWQEADEVVEVWLTVKVMGQSSWYRNETCSLLWPPYVIGQAIIFFLWVLSSFFFFFSSPNLSGRRLDAYHTWCGLSANLECRSEMCCTQLAEYTGCKKSPSGTIAQPCRAISSQLRHVSTIGKN